MAKRNKFTLSHSVKLTCNPGELVPVACYEVLPGDVISHGSSALIRTLPLLAPLMHKVDVRFHHWFVPNRLLWSSATSGATVWEAFITGGPDGNNASVHPTITLPNSGAGGVTAGSLANYLGVPIGNNADGTGYTVNALPFRAYALIWNNWYRDQDLQTLLTVGTSSGADTTTNTALQYINWEKDYFTSCRANPQKGTATTIGLAGNAPITGIGGANQNAQTGPITAYETTTGAASYSYYKDMDADANDRTYMKMSAATSGLPQVFANLAAATGVSVTALRQALSIQRFMEHRSRFGNRYIDYLMFLGIRPQDTRLQLPEYLGGGKSPLQFSEVLQTADNVVADAVEEGVGNLRGHGIGVVRTNRFKRHFPEHGIVLTLMSVRPRTGYTQGLSKMWNRTTKYDYWQKEYEHVGQTSVLNKEIKANHATPTGVFGYQDRYDEYRFFESRVAGEFATILDYWHMAQEYASDPSLNSSFIQCLPTNRVYADTSDTTDKLQVMVHHNIVARRLVAAKGSSFTM